MLPLLALTLSTNSAPTVCKYVHECFTHTHTHIYIYIYIYIYACKNSAQILDLCFLFRTGKLDSWLASHFIFCYISIYIYIYICDLPGQQMMFCLQFSVNGLGSFCCGTYFMACNIIIECKKWKISHSFITWHSASLSHTLGLL